MNRSTTSQSLVSSNPSIRSPRRSAVLMAVLLPALLLGACATNPNTPAPTTPIGSAPIPTPTQASGHLYELTIGGIGTGSMTGNIRALNTSGQKLGSQALQEIPTGINFVVKASSTLDVAGTRYLRATFNVVNNTGRTLSSLAFVPVRLIDSDGNAGNNGMAPTIGTTPFSKVQQYDGSPVAEAAANNVIPTTAKKEVNGEAVDDTTNGSYVQDSQYSALTFAPPAGLSVNPLASAWTVNPIPAGGSGLVTFAASFPISANAAENPYKFSLIFGSVADDQLSAADQRTIAFTPNVHPVAKANDTTAADPNWLGQAVVRGTDGTDYLAFKTYSANATAMRVDIHDASGTGRDSSVNMTKDSASNIWYAAVPLASVRTAGTTTPTTGLFDANLTYGLRAWGPNWTQDANWTPGSAAGFISDVDDNGNRFNPNKLLLDPYALEITHDYRTASNPAGAAAFTSGDTNRNTDTAPVAPRAYVALTRNADWTTLGTQATTGRIATPQKDDIIYEVHVRGFTKQDTAVIKQGTYAGAAEKAQYLKNLGVTAVEFLPIHETENDANDVDPTSTSGDNYWGYMTTNFFAPDRRYSSDQTPGGPTREFAAMAKVFKDAGIKVITDVVYNHTGEGGLWEDANKNKLVNQANLWSFRGLDNSTYYLLTKGTDANKFYYDITGTGNTMNTYNPIVQKLIIDSLKYQRNLLGVDGFRFDLGIALGNTYDNTTAPTDTQRFYFSGTDSNTALSKVAAALPNVYLSAEPWGLAPNGQGYQIGKFPAGWSEWNGKFRDEFRRKQNKLGTIYVPVDNLKTRFAGSSDLFHGADHNNRAPYNSVNFINVHDGMTLKDVYSCNGKYNTQPWPLGPSDGGTDDEDSWDNNATYGDGAANNVGQAQLQRQQARNAIAFLAVSQGVPIFNGGDEFLRTLNCNNNPYNLDSSGNWLNWTLSTDQQNFQNFTKAALNFRLAHPALRRDSFFDGSDHNGNGLADISWHAANVSNGIQPTNTVAFMVDGTEQNDSIIYMAYNAESDWMNFTIPSIPSSLKWYEVTNTKALNEGTAQFNANPTNAISGPGGQRNDPYWLAPRSVLILIAKP